MEQALRNRLTYGPLMLAGLLGLLALDHYAQVWTIQRGLNHGLGIGGIGLAGILAIVIPLATVEITALFAAEQVRPYRILSAAGSFALILHALLTQFAWFRPIAASTLASVIVGVMLLSALRRALDRQSQQAIQRMAGTLLATLYLGGLAWFLLALRVKHSPGFTGSTMIVLMILLVVKFADIGAYFGGRALGRHPLIPWLSPGKTWEGLLCGLVVAGLVGAACAPRVSELSWQKALVFGVVIGAIGQLGDLLESLMKRDAEVKDASRLIPGFGGVLDVIDSPLLAAPFAYAIFSLF
ncbi:MAG: phosphatidate cytidylyltransferase [Phycisphaerae bacterium]|nr:phosphatidate cytidylyltransferase [Phycisphaerae bacterium]MDW8261018.1 phosphatidate cytidylyltransferase [Phycisphaerales bacterium]